MKKTIISFTVIIIVIIVAAFVFDWGRGNYQVPQSNFNSLSVEHILHESTTTVEMPIVVDTVKDNQSVSSPINIKGKARGSWFFEASFPIQLVDDNGDILAATTARAESDWMTSDYVNFTATLNYEKSTTTLRGLIVLSKDNPSDNPDFDQSIFIPVILK